MCITTTYIHPFCRHPRGGTSDATATETEFCADPWKSPTGPPWPVQCTEGHGLDSRMKFADGIFCDDCDNRMMDGMSEVRLSDLQDDSDEVAERYRIGGPGALMGTFPEVEKGKDD